MNAMPLESATPKLIERAETRDTDETARRFVRGAKPTSIQDFVARYPRLLTRIAEAGQLPSMEQAAVILRDASARRKNYSDWVLTNHQADALEAVQHALRIKSGHGSSADSYR